MAYYSQSGDGSALAMIEALFHALSSSKCLSANNKRLDSDLAALSALVRY